MTHVDPDRLRAGEPAIDALLAGVIRPGTDPGIGEIDHLQQTGWLCQPVPADLGGPGLLLAAVCRRQRRLAYHATPLALRVQHHLAHLGAAADLQRQGDDSLAWLLEAAAAGRIVAGGLREPGNDVPLLHSATAAEPVDGGYRFTGRKQAGDLPARWQYLSVHGTDFSRRSAPRIVHALIPIDELGPLVNRAPDAPAISTIMLEGAFAPVSCVTRIVPPGFDGADPYVIALLTWTMLGEAAVCCGMAQRILHLTLDRLQRKTSIALSRSAMKYHAGIQATLAEMVIGLEGLVPHLDHVAERWDTPVTRPAEWLAATAIARDRATSVVRRVAALAVDLVGADEPIVGSELERLLGEASLGIPSRADRALTCEMVAKATLGIDLDQQPRWG